MRSGSQNWADVWASKGAHDENRHLELMDLLKFNGYDSGSDAISVTSWKAWISNLFKEIPEFKYIDTWMDIGCGAGGFLFSLPSQIKKSGCDYSQSLISVANLYASQNKITCSVYEQDMTDKNLVLPNVEIFSLISCLQYINQHEAMRLMEKIFQVATEGVLIAEIPNEEYFDESVSYRKNTLNYQQTEELKHTYYYPDIFDGLAAIYSFRGLAVKSKLGSQSKFRWSKYYRKISKN